MDWVDHLLRSRFTQDFESMIDRIATILASSEGMDVAPIAERMRQLLGDLWLRPFLQQEYGSPKLAIRLKQYLTERTPDIGTRLKRLRYLIAREREALFTRLRQDGATGDGLAAFRRDLSEIEDRSYRPEIHRFPSRKRTGFVARRLWLQ